MTAEEFLRTREFIKSIQSNDLIDEVMKNLNDIKNILTITKMMVIELQVRKEVENGKQEK